MLTEKARSEGLVGFSLYKIQNQAKLMYEVRSHGSLPQAESG